MSCHSQRGGEGRSEKAARGVDNAVDSDEYTADQEKAVKRYTTDKAVYNSMIFVYHKSLKMKKCSVVCQKVYKQGRDDSIETKVNTKAMSHP